MHHTPKSEGRDGKPERIAVLGMGAMGSRMAKSLLDAGHPVIVFDIDPAACDPLVDRGALSAPTPALAAAHASIVIAMVWDDAASAHVWLDPAVGALHAMSPGAIAMECATLTIEHEARLAERCRTAAIDFVSAPMAGSLPEADAKTLVFTVGASPAVYARVEPILLAMGSKINHAGEALDGISQKLIINGKLGIEYAFAAEMVALMAMARMDTDRRMAILSTIPAMSPRGLREAQFMLEGNHSVRVKVKQLIKDLENQIAQFESWSVPCPMHCAALEQFRRAAASGYSDRDATELFGIHQQAAISGRQAERHDLTSADFQPMARVEA